MKHLYQIILLLFVLTTVGMGTAYGQGKIKTHKSVKTVEVLKIFPNPADDQITLKAQNVKIGYIAIADIVGKEIVRFKANAENIYNVSFLRRGIYIVHVLDEKEELIKPLRLSKS